MAAAAPGARAAALAPGELTAAGELRELAADLARAAACLVAAADEWVTAPAEARPALRARLHRWQTVLALGARCLSRRRGGP